MAIGSDRNIVKETSPGRGISSSAPIPSDVPVESAAARGNGDFDVPPESVAAHSNGGAQSSREAHLVHEARKTIKRMRALARLLRYELGKEEFNRVNDSLRVIARRLAGERDAAVRLATLDDLKRRHPRALASDDIERLRERLALECAQASATARAYEPFGHERLSGPPGERELLEDIAKMRGELSSWGLLDPDFNTIAPGLRRIYREGRRRYADVRHEQHVDSTETHDWRKRVKALYYALDMLGSAKDGPLRATTKRAERLGDLLGEEHDLWMLADYISRHMDASGEDERSRDVLLEKIERRRERLRKRALELGARLYKRKPSAFIRRAGQALSG